MISVYTIPFGLPISCHRIVVQLPTCMHMESPLAGACREKFDRQGCFLVELITRAVASRLECATEPLIHPPAVMHNNRNRLPSQSHRYHPSQLPSDPNLGRYVADSVQDAHRLLAVYPFASATPTTHGQLLIEYISRGSYSISVARHLSNLTISPTYMHPQYQYMDHSDGEYGEYANELQYLTSGRPNPGDGGYWENTRNEAVRYLTETPSWCAKRHHLGLHELLIFYR